MTPTPIATQSDAIARADALTHLNVLAKSATAASETLTEYDVPFLKRDFMGKTVWRIKYDECSLKLKSAAPSIRDTFRRQFTVLIDGASGRLLSVESRYNGKAGELRPPATAEHAEKQLREDGEIYHGLPDAEPAISFLDALDGVMAKGIGSPYMAKEIRGIYVMHSGQASNLRPAWVVTLRGIPPLKPHGRHAETVPVWQRDHIRNVVDAMTGKCLFATNSPQPE